jgi:hypothetical protein
MLLALAVPSVASALEVQFEGYYRARARAFQSLSLASPDELSSSEGLAMYMQHRLWLRPQFLINDDVGVYVDLRALDGVYWGDEPGDSIDPVTDESIPVEYTDDLHAPTSLTDEDAALLDVTLWHAWGEFETRIGRFKFGRMPVRWGLGVWQNDGLSLNGDYGDTVDRVQWDKLFDDVFVELAIDQNAEGFVNLEDDTTSFNAAVGYRSEQITAGLNGQARITPVRDFSMFTLDGALEAEVGTVKIRGEGIGQFGSGNLADGVNDISITAAGAVLGVSLALDKFTLGAEAGLASGDGDDTDQKLRTFTFDRDYNVALILFEQTMPVLLPTAATEENLGRTDEIALSGPSLANAMYLRPTVRRSLIDGLDAEIALLAARTAKLPERYVGRNSYGLEIDTSLSYTAIQHVHLGGTFGVFLPGTWYSQYSDETYAGFDNTVFAGQVLGQIEF